MAHSDKKQLTFYFPNARVLSSGEVRPCRMTKRIGRGRRQGRSLARGPLPGWFPVGKDGKVTLQAAAWRAKRTRVLAQRVLPRRQLLWKGGTDLT